jgi:dihydrofolate reductase
MRTIKVTMSVTLDGVVQGLGRPDEDTRDGFTHGGWGARYQDEVMGQEMGRGMAEPGAMLFGRRTWQDFLGYWPHQTDNPFTDHLNSVTKYVATRTLRDVSAWQNSVLLTGEATRSVATLKAEPGPDLSIIGSAELVRALHHAGLVDRYTLLIHPLALGSGHRMFDQSSPVTEFTLVRSVPTTTGVIIATYERASERSVR